MACSPGSPELSKSDSDMASKLFTFTFTCLSPWPPRCPSCYLSPGLGLTLSSLIDVDASSTWR